VQVEELSPLLVRQRVAGPDPPALERLERDLERIAVIQVQADLQSARGERLDTDDAGDGHPRNIRRTGGRRDGERGPRRPLEPLRAASPQPPAALLRRACPAPTYQPVCMGP